MTSIGLAIFSSREDTHYLYRVVGAAADSMACAGGGQLDVLVNGSGKQAEALADLCQRERPQVKPNVNLRILKFVLCDKSATWNRYVYEVAPRNAEALVFVDGYALIDIGAVRALVETLRTDDALAAAAVPTVGRSARRLAIKMQMEGGIHGNLYALSGRTVDQIRSTSFRFPLGMYRNDSMLGAALAYGFDLGPREWNVKKRIPLAERAHWSVPKRYWWSPTDLLAWVRRRERQAQGELENASVKDSFVVRRREFSDLPPTVSELVHRWLQENPTEAEKVLRSRRFRKAWKRMQVPRDWADFDRPFNQLFAS